nr:MAG TPA: hypothetical protein [Caudoviricetes sp.]
MSFCFFPISLILCLCRPKKINQRICSVCN